MCSSCIELRKNKRVVDSFYKFGKRATTRTSLEYAALQLTAEIMAIHIRENNQIRGLRLPHSNEETKLSQYADDTTSYCLMITALQRRSTH